MIPINWVVGLAAILFAIGSIGVMTRRNPLIMFMAAEMMWNAAALAFIAFARHWHDMSGQIMAFVIVGTAAAEVGIGLAIIVSVYHRRHRLDIDEISGMRN